MRIRATLGLMVLFFALPTFAASPQYPNEPAGFTPFAEWDASVRLKYGPQTYPGVLGKWYECPSPCGGTNQNNNQNFWQTTDPAAPQSPSTVMVTRFPRGHQGGSAPGNLGGWDATGKEYDQIYFSLWLLINDTNGDGMYENHPVLTKMGWTGSGDAPATAANQNFYVLLGGTQIPGCTNSPNLPFNPNNLYCNNQASAFRVGVYQQGPILNGVAMHRNMGQNQNTQALMTVGSWHHWEAVWKISTPGSAAPCASNPAFYCGDGAITMWIDGILTMNYTDVALTTPTATHAFTNYYWNPTWGGSNTTWRNYEDSMLIDHIYISGVPKGSSPTPAQCGNGILESGEQCDGTALGGATCVSRGFTGGTLSCSASCTLVTSACTSTDITNPTVSFSAPASGATVSAITTVTATASDNVGVTQVQFTLDGANLGSPDTTSPYSISWDTTSATNAQHTLGAVARDAAGNTASATRTVTVNNAAAPQCGNNIIENGEQCEGSNLNGASCTSLGFTSGTLSCSNCQYNTNSCTANTLPSGLLARYTFDTDASDSTTNKIDGTLINGASIGTGRTGNALILDGVNDYVDYGTPALLNDKRPITITAWINPTAAGYLISKRMGTCTGYWRFDPLVAAPLLAPGRTLAAANNPPLNTWSHITLTDDGTTAKMYINGIDASGAMSTNTISGSDGACKLTVGTRDATQSFFGGKIDELRIYNRALSQTEIQTDMNYNGATTPPPKTGDLNNDGTVNILDVQRVITKLGTPATSGEDLNNDGTVNIFDLVKIAQNWG